MDSVGDAAGAVDDWQEEERGLARNGWDSGRGDSVCPEATPRGRNSSDQTVAAMQKDFVNKIRRPPGGVL